MENEKLNEKYKCILCGDKISVSQYVNNDKMCSDCLKKTQLSKSHPHKVIIPTCYFCENQALVKCKKCGKLACLTHEYSTRGYGIYKKKWCSQCMKKLDETRVCFLFMIFSLLLASYWKFFSLK